LPRLLEVGGQVEGTRPRSRPWLGAAIAARPPLARRTVSRT